MNKMKEFPEKSNLVKIWKFAYEDNRGFYDDTKPPSIKKREVKDFFERVNVNISECIRLAPIDPSKAISLENECIVSLPTLPGLHCWQYGRTRVAAVFTALL
jgi:hypothetical protein